MPCAGGIASAGGSPAKQQLSQLQQQEQLSWSSADRSPVSPSQVVSSQGDPSQLDFGRLRLTSSPGDSSAGSPRPPHARQVRDAAPSPAELPASQAPPSLRRWQQQFQDWCVPPSPDNACSSQEAPATAAAAAPPPAATPLAAAPPAAATPPPVSPFNSSQERRREIALLSELGEGTGAWSSQEGSQAAVGSQGTSDSSQAAGDSQLPYVCSLNSQELTEGAQPWSQSSAEEASPAQLAAQREERPQMRPVLSPLGQQQQAAGQEDGPRPQQPGCAQVSRSFCGPAV